MTSIPGRNDRCPCGSGHKYKRCCGMQERPAVASPSLAVGRVLPKGLRFFPLEELKGMSLSVLKHQVFPGSAYFAAQEELDYLDFGGPGSFEALKLHDGSLSVGARFDVPVFDEFGYTDPFNGDEIVCQCVLQEQSPRASLLGACDCPLGLKNQPCGHVFGLLLLFWGLLRREYPWVQGIQGTHGPQGSDGDTSVFEELLEPRLDAALGRAGRINAEAGLSLEGVIFCLPDPGTELGKSDGVIQLKAQKALTQKEIARGRLAHAMSAVTEADALPRRLQMASHPNLFQWGRASENPLLECVQYLFSDGSCLSASELLSHRRVKKVPRELLPLREVAPEIVPVWARLNPRNIPSWMRMADAELGELSRSMLGVVARALRSGVPVLAVTDARRSVDRSAVPVTALDFAVDAETPLYRLLPGEAENEACFELTLDARAELRFESGRLTLLPGPAAAEVMPEYLSHEVTGQEQILERLAEVQGGLKLLRLPGVALPPEAPTELSITRPELWLDEGGSLSFARGLPGLEARLWNLDPLSRSWLLVLQGGIGALVEGPNTEIAHSRRGAKREADLKLLRHCGFAASVFYDCVCFAFKGSSSTGEKFADVSEFKGWLKDRQNHLALAIVGAASVPGKPIELEKLCSQRVASLVHQFASQVLESLKSPGRHLSLVRGQIVWTEGTAVAFAQVAERLIAAEALLTGGQCFTRSRVPACLAPAATPWATPDSPVFATADLTLRQPREGASIAVLAAPHALRVCLSLAAEGFGVFWKGKSVAQLASEDIQAIFDLQQSSKPAGRALGRGPLDWFELNPKIFLLGRELNRAQLNELSRTGMIEYQGRLYSVNESQLPSLRRLSRFWDRLQGRPTGLSGFADAEGAYRKLPRSESLELLALERDLGAQVRGDCPEWSEVREFFRSLDQPRAHGPLPPGVRAELKPYQRAGVQWFEDLHRLKLGGVLADDMGLGKTLQALVFLESLREQGRLGQSLIVVPTSLAWNWQSEAERFTPGLPVRVFEPKDRVKAKTKPGQPPGAEVLIVTYGLLTEHAEWFAQAEDGAARAWDVVIFDEAQSLKNIRSKRSDAARSLQAQYKFCLTGTPLENHLGELYSIVDLVVPGALGELSDFRQRYEAVHKVDDVDAAQSVLELGFLRRVLRPLLLRRTKSQVLQELPPKTESRVGLPLERQQKKIYRDVALSWNRQVQDSIRDHGEARSQLVMLTALLRLRQVCSDPASVPGVKYPALPPKIELLAEAVPEILESGESILVFTQFVSTLERVRAHLESQGAQVSVIHGAVTRSEREKILRRFQDPAAPAQILLMTLKTGGVGLNLTRASYVFHLEPWWNPAVENQATDRAHRLGQDRPVQVYRYLMNDTVEEKIELLKTRKSAVFEAVMTDAEAIDGPVVQQSDGTKPGLRALSRSDFELLLETAVKS